MVNEMITLFMILGIYIVVGVVSVLAMAFIVFCATGFHYFEWFLKKAENNMDN